MYLYIKKQTNKNTMVLSLNKIAKGRYQKRAGEILVTVQQLHDKTWQGTIEKYEYTAKDLFDNDVEIFDLVFDVTYGQTKREVYEILTNQIKSM